MMREIIWAFVLLLSCCCTRWSEVVFLEGWLLLFYIASKSLFCSWWWRRCNCLIFIIYSLFYVISLLFLLFFKWPMKIVIFSIQILLFLLIRLLNLNWPLIWWLVMILIPLNTSNYLIRWCISAVIHIVINGCFPPKKDIKLYMNIIKLLRFKLLLLLLTKRRLLTPLSILLSSV